ncbi:hypothetical protein [Nostoc commune]|uniref:hypothetical protein n=1 Tax=Nostoc commune TaxID=1178 RepID=UPI0018C642E7|nr:hypothetical protein [Nostoc commune]MBG1261516.1 hypothetical protein [Nostoc commune BAE]MBG1261556.1 hypothetical protein [Nostoc commune BAE]
MFIVNIPMSVTGEPYHQGNKIQMRSHSTYNQPRAIAFIICFKEANFRLGAIATIGVNLSLNAYSTGVLPPLIPPWKGGKRNLVPSPLQATVYT